MLVQLARIVAVLPLEVVVVLTATSAARVSTLNCVLLSIDLTHRRHARLSRLLLCVGQRLQLLLEQRELLVRIDTRWRLSRLLLDERLALFSFILSLNLLALPFRCFLGSDLGR